MKSLDIQIVGKNVLYNDTDNHKMVSKILNRTDFKTEDEFIKFTVDKIKILLELSKFELDKTYCIYFFVSKFVVIMKETTDSILIITVLEKDMTRKECIPHVIMEWISETILRTTKKTICDKCLELPF